MTDTIETAPVDNTPAETTVDTGASVDTGSNVETSSAEPQASWRDGLSEDFRSNESLSEFNSVDDLVKSFLDGKNQTAEYPTSEWDEEKLNDYYSKIRPESEESYKFNEAFDEDDVKFFSKTAHDNGLTEKQAENMSNAIAEIGNKQREELYSKEGYEKTMGDIFQGNEEERTQVLNHIKDSYSDEDKAIIESMPNEYVGILFKGIKNDLKAFGANEGTALNNPANGGVMSEDAVKQQRAGIKKEIEALSTKPHTREQKSELLNRLQSTYK